MREVSNMTQQIGVVGLAVMGKTSLGILNHAVIAFLYITVQAKKQMKWLMNLKVNKSTQHILWKNLLIH